MAQVYLKDYIEHLQKQLEEHGNLPVYYEEDDFYQPKEMLGKDEIVIPGDTWYPECTKIVETAMMAYPNEEFETAVTEYHEHYDRKLEVDKSKLFKIIVI